MLFSNTRVALALDCLLGSRLMVLQDCWTFMRPAEHLMCDLEQREADDEHWMSDR